MIRGASPAKRAPRRRFSAAGFFLLVPALTAAGAVLALTDAEVVAPTGDFSKPEAFERLPGGALTSRKKPNADAFSHNSANMSFEKQLDFRVGDGLFRRLWVSAPASTRAADGLGPLFNARACQRCHLRDGRGHPPAGNWPDDDATSMFLRLGIPPRTEAERQALASGRRAVIPEPTYGARAAQLADDAPGHGNVLHEPPDPRPHRPEDQAPGFREVAAGETDGLRPEVDDGRSGVLRRGAGFVDRIGWFEAVGVVA